MTSECCFNRSGVMCVFGDGGGPPDIGGPPTQYAPCDSQVASTTTPATVSDASHTRVTKWKHVASFIDGPPDSDNEFDFALYVDGPLTDEEQKKHEETIKRCSRWKESLNNVGEFLCDVRLFFLQHRQINEELEAIKNTAAKMALELSPILSQPDIPVRRKWLKHYAREFDTLDLRFAEFRRVAKTVLKTSLDNVVIFLSWLRLDWLQNSEIQEEQEAIKNCCEDGTRGEDPLRRPGSRQGGRV